MCARSAGRVDNDLPLDVGIGCDCSGNIAPC